MQKKNKIFMGIISALLCLTLLSTSLLSSVFARYTRSDGVKISEVGIKKLGLTATSGTDLSSSYKLVVDIDGDGTDDEINAVQSTQNVIAPGTHGCLAWVRVKGTPEVKYDLDFEGSFTMGDGFKSASGYILDSSGGAIDYFPLAIYLVAYDVTAEKNGVLTLQKVSADVKNDINTAMDTKVCHNRKTDGANIRFFSGTGFSKIADVHNVLDSGTYSGSNDSDYYKNCLDYVFDKSNNDPEAIDRIYTVQWWWPYKHGDSYPYKGSSNGTTGQYQRKEYDSQIAEAIANGSTAFNITADLDVDIKQSSPAAT